MTKKSAIYHPSEKFFYIATDKVLIYNEEQYIAVIVDKILTPIYYFIMNAKFACVHTSEVLPDPNDLITLEFKFKYRRWHMVCVSLRLVLIIYNKIISFKPIYATVNRRIS